jgi:hypothetical protein
MRLKDGRLFYIGVLEEYELGCRTGERIYVAMDISVRNGQVGSGTVLARGPDVKTCAERAAAFREHGRRFAGGELTFDRPTAQPIRYSEHCKCVLEDLQINEISLARSALGVGS